MKELVASSKSIDIKQYQYDVDVVYVNKWSGEVITEVEYITMVINEYIEEWYTEIYHKYYDHNICNYIQERLLNDTNHDWMIKHKEFIQ